MVFPSLLTSLGAIIGCLLVGFLWRLVRPTIPRLLSLHSSEQCRNLHVGVPGYRPPKVISTHFCRLVTDSATTFPQAHLRGRLDEEDFSKKWQQYAIFDVIFVQLKSSSSLAVLRYRRRRRGSHLVLEFWLK